MHKIIRLLAAISLSIMALALIMSNASQPQSAVVAHVGDAIGPACGFAKIDGVIDLTEWSNAATQAFTMTGSAMPLSATLRVMNSASNLYIGITINDDEFSTTANTVPRGDAFRIDFDNDHSGTLFTLNDDVLSVSAGTPQFQDYYINGNPVPSSSAEDLTGGGSSDGVGAASRMSGLNHFEIKHPLCSGDSLDFCLNASDVIGFRLEYLDAEGDGSFGGSLLHPGATISSVADMEIGSCSLVLDAFVYVPLIFK